MALSCVGIFFLAWLYEGLKVFRERWFYNSIQYDRSRKISKITESFSGRCFGDHILQTILHVIQIVLSYFLMLIFMTYNGYLCIAVAAGSGFGYLTFGWLRRTFQDTTEHCH
ncbi:expressed hypothetical protein [Trichoplax adhaerens]|uniref:Copper transport protein n=1 Tax=Trichoplax adhaerens TaxID=10228 RepID=B3RP80_TRIAD|nr:expressed hypothetical protein [Trichoplax adhaerens]EDV27589.1 expressed hypothetical protein [Trichoplax adhaerens]|eukprot:XP_002109423.1 expressed hypothetical protein [Trichoplax adhaerens]